jgi:hypothetical protein
LTEPWESLPDLPPDAELKPFDPDAFLADSAPPADQPFDPDAFLVGPDLPSDSDRAPIPDAELEDAQDVLVGWAFEEAQRTNQSDELVALHLAEKLGLPSTTVRAALPEFKRVASLVDFEPKKWREQAPPELKRLIFRNPSLAPAVVTDETPGVLTIALRELARAAWDFPWSMIGPLKPERDLSAANEVLAEQESTQAVAARWWADDAERAAAQAKLADVAWQGRVTEAQTTVERIKKEFGATPTLVARLDDSQATQAREEGAAGFLGQRYAESEAGLEASRLRFQRLMLKAQGADEEHLVDVSSRIHDLELEAQPRALGEGELGRLAGQGVQGIASTLDVLPYVGARGAALATVGALAGGAVGSRVPGGTQKGAAEGAKLGLQVGAAAGAFEASFYVEAGSTSKELEAVTTDAGKKLTDDEVLGGALTAGALKAGLEVMEAQAVLSTFGPTKALFATHGGPRAFVEKLLSSDPRFRAMAARAAGQWVKSSAQEGAEEALQTATDQLVKYAVASLEDGAPQVGPVLNTTEIAESAVAGAVGGSMMGAVGTGTQLVAGAIASRQAARAPRQVGSILELSKHPAAQAAPKDFAQAATEATATTGAPVTALHVDAAAVQRFFQERGDEAEVARQITEALGPDGPARVAEAVASGAKVEIPLEVVLERWGRSEAATALKDDTTTHPALPTPREQATAPKELDVIRLAQEEATRAKEEQALDEQVAAYRQQLVAAGRSRSEATAGAAILRAFMATQAKDFQTSVAELFPELPITAARGDETPAHRLAQEPTTGPAAPPKGYMEAPEVNATSRVVRVFLNRSADVSTVVHESAHGFLELLQGLAARPDAPQRTKETWEAARTFLGHESGELTREQHESFARTFEAYLMDGRAPSSALAKTFGRLKSWLTTIYRAIRRVPGADLNDGARQVFDALLATEDELAAYRRAQGPSLFNNAQEAGVSEEEWRAQLEAHREAMAEGGRRAELRVLKDVLRRKEQWWKDGVKALRAAYEEQYEQLPARRLQLLLMGQLPGQTEAIVLDRAEVEAVIGQARVPGLKTAVEGGIRPSDVAELAGFPNASAMLGTLASLKPKGQWVTEAAEAEMQRQHPGVLDDREKMRALVADGLAGATEKRLLDEWAALRRKDPRVGTAPVAELKRAAKELAGKRPVGKLAPGLALVQERAAANRKAKAAAKGNVGEAVKAARQQFLNGYLHRELLDAQAALGRLEEAAKEMGKRAARERLGKASPLYRDAVAFLLGSLGLGVAPAELDASVFPAAVAQMNGDAVLVGDPDWLAPVLAALRSVHTHRALTVGQMAHVQAALDNLRAAARHRTEVLVDGKAADKEATVAALIAEAAENKRQVGELPSSAAAATLGQNLKALPGRFFAPQLKIETMVNWLGGSLKLKNPRKSTWYRAIFKPLESAMEHEADIYKGTVAPIVRAFQDIPKAVRRTWMDPIDGRALFPEHQVAGGRQLVAPPSRRFELMMMALNAGNASNLERLTKGRRISLAQLHGALDLLTKEEVAWVNAVGEALESLWPQVQALEERVTGVKPQAIERQPLALKNGVISGHYFPAIYDQRVEAVGERQVADSVAALMDPTFGRYGTRHSHTKERTEGFFGAIKLDPNAVGVHLLQVAHDLAFRERLMSVGKLVLDERVQSSLKSALGEARAAQFQQWVKDNGTAQGVEGAINAGIFLDILRKTRAGTVAAALGYSVPNFFEDLSAIPAAFLADKELKSRFLTRGLLEFMKAPAETITRVRELSGTVRSMHDSIQRQFASRIGELTLQGPLSRVLGPLREHQFDLMEATFTGTATPIWLGRYLQELDGGATESEAVDAADQTLRRRFPMHSTVNAAGVLRDRGVIGLSLQFFSFLSTVANEVLDNAQMIRETPGVLNKAMVAGRTLGLFVAVSLIGGLLRGKGPDEDEEPQDWVLRRFVEFSVGLVPGGGDAAAIIDGAIRHQPVRANRSMSSPGYLLATLADAAVMAMSDKEDSRKVEALLRAAGPFLNVPGTSQAIRTGKYLSEAASGDRVVRNPGDFVSGVIYGENDRRPATVPRIVGEAVFGE